MLNGIHRRERAGWEQTRWLAFLITNILGGKVSSPAELQEFPWEKKKLTQEEIDAEAEQARQLLEECRRRNESVS